MIKSCYIHIPFCDTICSYCDFCKVYKTDKWIDLYLDNLEKEIKSNPVKDSLETIYIGGGTPSCLSPSQLERLLKIIDTLPKKEIIEYTIEGNFESTTKEKLLLYKKYGINRLSFGIETTNNELLKKINRVSNKEEIRIILEEAKKIGLNNINIDMIYGIPNETINDIKNDLDFILSLEPTHISAYSLIFEKHTILTINKEKPVPEELELEMINKINQVLKENQYEHYEISNYAKANYQSKHNKTYWKNEEYYAYGLGASSYIDDKREKTTRSLTKYLNGIITKETEVLSKKDKIIYEIILNLRTKDGISLENFYKKYQVELKDLYNYQELINNNFLKEENNQLSIPEDKWYISNEIIVKVLEGEINE